MPPRLLVSDSSEILEEKCLGEFWPVEYFECSLELTFESLLYAIPFSPPFSLPFPTPSRLLISSSESLLSVSSYVSLELLRLYHLPKFLHGDDLFLSGHCLSEIFHAYLFACLCRSRYRLPRYHHHLLRLNACVFSFP